MAAIGKIRQHYALLIVIVGLALLAFVLGDLFKSTGRGRGTTNVAIVNGEKVTYQEFTKRSESQLENAKRQNGNLDQEQTLTLRSQVLDMMIREIIMNEEMSDLGLVVSDKELYEQFLGENPNQYVLQNFTDKDGNFDRAGIENYLQNFNDLPVENRLAWKEFEEAIRNDRLNTKYQNLIKQSYYLPTKLAEKMYGAKNENVDIDVYAVRYNTIADSTVVVTDADKKAFYKENKNRFKTDEIRAIDYVMFELKPSEEDIAAARKYVADMKDAFAEVEDYKDYVNKNSQKAFEDAWKGESELPVAVAEELLNPDTEIGYVTEPYEDNGFYNIARLVERGQRYDSLRASHILIGFQGAMRSTSTRTEEEAKAKADSIVKVLKSTKHADFAALAEELSEDPSAKGKGGDLDWFKDGAMVPEFNNFAQENKEGTIDVVKTMFGYHVIKVTGRKSLNEKVKVAVLAQEISTSMRTEQAIFAEANKFVTEAKDQELFDATAEKQGINKHTYNNITTKTTRIATLANPRSLVKWIFDSKTKVGTVSNIIDLDGMYVVAIVTDITPKGYQSMERVAELRSTQILKTVKGKMLLEKATAYGTDYDKMINELGGEKQTLTDINLKTVNVGNFGGDDKLIGIALGLGEGMTSAPFAGDNAIYVVKVNKHNAAESQTDYSDIVKEQRTKFGNTILNDGAYNAIKKLADIEDNSLLFF